MYIECEETDPELKTNLQPLNEFRAALDHVMRLLTIEITKPSLQDDDDSFDKEYEKTKSHLCRAFYDVSDMLSLNYRNKIIDILERYTTEEIQMAIPIYYSKLRIEIDEISLSISKIRNNKGIQENSEIDYFSEYTKKVERLRDIYQTIAGSAVSLDEIHNKNVKDLDEKKLEIVKDKKMEKRNAWLIAIVSLVVGSILTFIITAIAK